MSRAAPKTAQPAAKPTTHLRHATKDNAPLVEGRRTFFKYRDLGVTEASAGKLRAQVMQTVADMKKPTGWHYHECDGQFIYLIKGWVDLEFETGEKVRVSEGESLFIPGGMKHNETALSSDSEILELSVPAEMATVACESPL